MDGNGDYMDIPRFAGVHNEGNFTISAWVYPSNLGLDSNVQDAAIFGANGNNADTVLVWYNVNGASTANRTFTFNIGQSSIGLNRLDGPDSLAIQDRWQHVAAVMSGQGRKIYHNGILVADSIGSDNIVKIEGNDVRVGAWTGSGNMDFEGSLDEVRIYNRSFNSADISILYGNGNGDLGLTPLITLDSQNSATSMNGRVEFLKFGVPQNVSGLTSNDFVVSGGTVDSLVLNGTGYDFNLTASSYPSIIDLSLPAGVQSAGTAQSQSISQTFTQSNSLTATDDLILWYTFDELSGSLGVDDLSGRGVTGQVSSGTIVPGKFGSSLMLDRGEYLSLDGELLSLTHSFTLSLWAKVLDDEKGVLVRNGQFSLQYGDDNTISGLARTGSGWGETKARLPSGKWAQYVISYDESYIRLYIDGVLLSELAYSGYLLWGDGNDHNVYLNRWTTPGGGWDAKAVYDDFRIYNRGLTESEIDLLWSSGAGDLGVSPLISGADPFFLVPSPHAVSFIENNQTVSVNGLLQAEINASNATLLNYDSVNYTFDLNLTTYPELVRVSIPHGAVEKDGNQSVSTAFEFRRRIITSVEDDLIAWYPLDDFNGTKVFDRSGRMRDGTFYSVDADPPRVTVGKFGNALDVNGEYVDLPFKIDQSGNDGMSLSAWIYPRQVDGGTDNERVIFGTDNGGWDWSMTIRMGSFSAWTGTTRYQSPLTIYSNNWYHCVSVFDPVSSKTTLHLNGGSITTDSLGLDSNSNLIRLGSHFGNRSFDGLIDDVRIWGRPLSVSEVAKLWGNGMGDLGPNARFEFDSIAWSNQISGKMVLNQPVNDFNASQDIELTGLTLTSISEEPNSAGTIYNLVLSPNNFTPSTLTVGLAENSITDLQGVQNSEIAKFIEFRPHRVKESDLLLWWEFNSSALGGGVSAPTDISNLEVWFDANDTSSVTHDVNNTISLWQDKSGNNRDASISIGQPIFNTSGGPAGLPAVEIRRTGGNDALAIGGAPFFAKEHFYVFRSVGSSFDFYGGVLGHTSTYPSSRQSNYLFENGRTYFHGNRYPAVVSKNGSLLSVPFDLSPINQFMILRLQVDDTNPGPHSDYRIGTITDGSNYSSSIDIAEIIAFSSVLSANDVSRIEIYLKKKWGVLGVLDTTSQLNHGTGTPNYGAAKFGSGISLDGTFSKSVSSFIPSLPSNAVSLSAWIYPETEDFHLFNTNGLPIPASISLRKQRPLLTMLGLDQTSLPGTNINEFWAHGYFELNKWSHLVLTYDLSTKKVLFFLNGKLDSVSSFAGNLPFPLTDGFRLGPTDDYQAMATSGKIDDFRIYGTALKNDEVTKLYGSGLGDFNRKTIQITPSPEFELPKTINVHFLDDGIPVEVVPSGSDAFELNDITTTNSSPAGLVKVPNSIGHYQFKLIPDDNSSTASLFIQINGGGIKTTGITDSFEDANSTFVYDPQLPVISSSSVSFWSTGDYSSFAVISEGSSTVSVSSLPTGLEFNASSQIIYGLPLIGGDFTVTITASNPASSTVQNHLLKIIDPLSFSSKLELSPNFSSLGEVPSDFPGLSLHLDANLLSDLNGSILTSWADSSGNDRGLSEARGTPRVFVSPDVNGLKVVSFDGLSQLYSTYDFGGLLSEYSILGIMRHTGTKNGAVIASVGSDWVFGLGNEKSSYWKLGSTEISGPSADSDWHIFTGTLDANGSVELRRDGYVTTNGAENVILDANAKPKFLSLGGAQTNDRFSQAEIGEVLLFNRKISQNEVQKLEAYLRRKWLGGSLQNFPFLVRLSSHIPGFNLENFAAPSTGGDLRFFDNHNRELSFEIDEWNASGESLVWLEALDFDSSSKFYAYWGNDSNTSLPSSSLWSSYTGVWHLSDNLDSSISNRDAATEGTVTLGQNSLIGRGMNLNGAGNLITNSYKGILGGQARTVSLWMRSVDDGHPVLSWGAVGNHWSVSWTAYGPKVLLGSGGVRLGNSTLNSNQWHHLMISYPGNSADINATRIYWDGTLVDSPGSSLNGIVSTVAGNDLRIGSSIDGTVQMSGSLDEVRLSHLYRGPAWSKYEFENQKMGGELLTYDLEYQLPPIFSEDLNFSIVQGQAFSFQIRSQPLASEYTLSGGSLPSGVSLNSATGILEGSTTDSLNTINLILTASNAKGSASTNFNIQIKSSITTPEISVGSVIETFGRSVDLRGTLSDSGGVSNEVTVYFGLSDGLEVAGDWNKSKIIGMVDQGTFDLHLDGLDSGRTYYYRFHADNSLTDWSEVDTFTTLRFDQGVVRINTGDDELGTNAGFFWDRKNGEGETKVYDANFSIKSYLAPNGSSWKISKSIFQINENLLIGANLDEVRLEGINALSLEIDGNLTVAKNLTGSPSPLLPHLAGGTLTDGYDAYYSDDPSKGMRMGLGALGGFGGGKGPGQGFSLGSTGAGGITGGGGSFAGEGGSAASAPAGIRYGSGGLDILMGGSGGGIGNGGDAAAGGGAIEFVVSGNATVETGVRISMNGGTVFVNPSVGANFSGGSGAGGAIRIVANSIQNKGILEVRGGDASGGDFRESGSKYLRDAGGAGGGGRVALIADGLISKGNVNVNGGNGNADGSAGYPGSLFIGKKTPTSPQALSVNDGTLIFDTGGSWLHSSGLKGKGDLNSSYIENAGDRFGYTVCRFHFVSLDIGADVDVEIRGENSLEIKVDGNVMIASSFSLDGSSGQQGIYSGKGGPGGWSSGRGLRNTDLFSNLHPALNGGGPGGGRGYEIGKSTGGGSFGGVGTGGLGGGVAGLTYGDSTLSDLIGGSGGGHAIRGSGNAGGGGGAISIIAGGSFILEANAYITANGGLGTSHYDGSGAGGSGGAVRIEAGSITNRGRIDAKGGNASGDSSLAGAGGGGRIVLLTSGAIVEGDTNASGGRNLSIVHANYRSTDLVAHWTLDDNTSSNIALNLQGDVALNGIISGKPVRRAGKKGGAFYFDGNDDKITISYDNALAIDEYTVSMWYFPERNNEGWTGLFGRGNGTEGRIHSIWQGDSSHGTRPYLHHRFGEGTNWNEGVDNFVLNQWKQWYHLVFTNSGLSGKYARTYVNGSFATGTQRYERRVLNELMIDYSSDLYIGAAPDHGNGGYFMGIIDDVRLYRKGFGSEDVHHLYRGDPGVDDYEVANDGAKNGNAGTILKITSPVLPVLSTQILSYGDEVVNLDLGESQSLNYSVGGLPPGLSNESGFDPKTIPGLFAWYNVDANGSIEFHPTRSYDRNESVLSDNLIVYLPFDEVNGSIAYDFSANGNHAQLIDQATWDIGFSGGSVSFDGSNDGMVFEKISALDRPDSFSIAFWFKRFTQMVGIPTNHEIDNLMLAQSSSYDNDNLEIGSEGSEIEIYLDSGSGTEDTSYTTTGAGVSDGTWHHLVLSYGNGLKVYVDGVERLSQPQYSGPLDSSLDSPLSLGMGRIFSDQWGDFNGSIDDFRIYDVEVNATHVSSIYNSGLGDFGGSVSTSYASGRVRRLHDLSLNLRDAESSFSSAPLVSFDPETGNRMIKLDYGKSLRIPNATSMPMTIYLVGFETGYSFPDRELFTFEGWRMIQSGLWGLRRWSDNNPQLATTASSTLKSLVGWTISRYGYEVRINGEVVRNSISGNWRPEALFDRINGNTEWVAGEILLFPRILELSEKIKIEGYLANHWKMQHVLPDQHLYKLTKPVGRSGLVLSGRPEQAGVFEISVAASNQWGQVTDTFNLEVLPKRPKVQTSKATQVGSRSARLQANVFDLGGMDSNLSFLWGTNPNLVAPAETDILNVSSTGSSSILLNNLGPSTTYYYQAKLVNPGGLSNGDDISATNAHYWELNDTGSTAYDQGGAVSGNITGASSTISSKGRVLLFDGDNDYVDLGDIDEMDQIDRFSLSLWFKRGADNSSVPSSNGVDNVLVSQSSESANDNFEIGTQGSEIEIYIDSGTASTDQTVRFDAGITNNVWYHLALVYGSEMAVYLNGVKINTWTQYNGRLESSANSPLALGISRPNDQQWGDFTGEMHRVQLFYEELSSDEIELLAGLGSIRSFSTWRIGCSSYH
jgi:hypothetical protein